MLFSRPCERTNWIVQRGAAFVFCAVFYSTNTKMFVLPGLKNGGLYKSVHETNNAYSRTFNCAYAVMDQNSYPEPSEVHWVSI